MHWEISLFTMLLALWNLFGLMETQFGLRCYMCSTKGSPKTMCGKPLDRAEYRTKLVRYCNLTAQQNFMINNRTIKPAFCYTRVSLTLNRKKNQTLYTIQRGCALKCNVGNEFLASPPNYDTNDTDVTCCTQHECNDGITVVHKPNVFTVTTLMTVVSGMTGLLRINRLFV